MFEDKSSSVRASSIFLTREIQFLCILIIIIPSIICSLFTLYNLLFDRTLRNTLNNHIIIIILVIGLFYETTVYPWMLYFYHGNGQWQRSISFCYFSAYISWTLYILEGMLFAWASIERHILVFHDRWVSTKKKQLFVHYLPIFILIGYCLIFYIVFYFFPPCDNSYNTNNLTCMDFCITYNHYFIMWDTIAHQFVPGLIIILFNVALLIRVIWKRVHINQPVQWRKYRKMSIQLFSLSFIYLIFYFPYIFLCFFYLYGYFHEVDINVWFMLSFLTYFMILFLPFACMLTLPDLGNRIKYFWRFGRLPLTIQPVTITVKRTFVQ